MKSYDLYITFRDVSNHFQYTAFIRDDKIIMNDIIQKHCTQLVSVPKWYPKHNFLLKPYLYYNSLPKYI